MSDASCTKVVIDRIEDSVREGVPDVGHIFFEPDSAYDAKKDDEHPDGIVKPSS